MTSKNSPNPFYVLLVLVGILFFITATTYGVMTVHGLYPNEDAGLKTSISVDASSGFGLMQWMDQYGFSLLIIELGALAAFTVAAIGTDNYWSNRSQKRPDAQSD